MISKFKGALSQHVRQPSLDIRGPMSPNSPVWGRLTPCMSVQFPQKVKKQATNFTDIQDSELSQV